MAFIITGHHRSGTSILALLCKTHPQISLTNEFGNFSAVGDPYPEYAKKILRIWWKKRNVPLTLSFEYPQKIKGTFMLENLVFVARYLSSIRKLTDGKVTVENIEAALRGLLPEASLVGDKHPDYILGLDRLINQEGLRCVFIFRDPRDLAGSMVEKSRTIWRSYFPEEFQVARHIAERWVKMIESAESYSDQIVIICYEDLVANPPQALAHLGEKLNVDPSGFQADILRQDSVGSYQGRLTTEEVADVIDVAGSVMQRLGYTI